MVKLPLEYVEWASRQGIVIHIGPFTLPIPFWRDRAPSGQRVKAGSEMALPFFGSFL
jgi:hypothetical protein